MKKLSLKKAEKNSLNIVLFVENSFVKLKKFTTVEQMNAFVSGFKAEYRGLEMDGYWIDCTFSDVGEINIFDSNIIVE